MRMKRPERPSSAKRECYHAPWQAQVPLDAARACSVAGVCDTRAGAGGSRGRSLLTSRHVRDQTPQPAPAAAAARAASPPADPQQPTFRTGINFVRVDVIVTDRQGNPVVDLKQTDFEVLEDGKPQTIESFRFVKVDGSRAGRDASAASARAPTKSGPRPTRMRASSCSSSTTITCGSATAWRRASRSSSSSRTASAPNDLVAVMYPLSPLDAVTLTRDHQSVIRVLERFEGRKFNYEPRTPPSSATRCIRPRPSSASAARCR